MMDEISVYIHIPFCKSKCIYCDFFSKPEFCTDFYFSSYIQSLCKEITFYSKLIGCKKVKSIYIGGGTPSLIPIPELKKIFDCIKNNFEIDFNNYECTLEINPDDVSKLLIDFLNTSLVNRISLGVQSLKNETLKLMNRRATREVTISALRLLNKYFVKRFSVDLIAGFPYETSDELIENLKEVFCFNPEHISLYSLCIEEETLLYKKIQNNKIIFNQETSDECWLKAKSYLEKNNFTQYEISNFSKDEKSQSIHNLSYWHLKDYLGFGSGATGSLFFDDKDSVRYTNSYDIKKYIEFWKNFSAETFDFKCEQERIDFDFFKKRNFPFRVEYINKATQEFEFFMMGFRLNSGISKNEYESRFKKSIFDRLNLNNNLFSRWVQKGLAEIYQTKNDSFFRLTKDGILYLNSFLEQI